LYFCNFLFCSSTGYCQMPCLSCLCFAVVFTHQCIMIVP
jgi:hypothetical protein